MSITPIPLSYYDNDGIIEMQKSIAGLQYSFSNLRWDPSGLER